MAVAAAKKRKRRKDTTQWGWRLAGIVLCAFFVLGVITGLSRPGRRLELRFHRLLDWRSYTHGSLNPLTALRRHSEAVPAINPAGADARSQAVALVERPDGFYLLTSQGEIRGPISPTEAGDLPILSGPAVANASGSRLVEDAGVLVRAEAALSKLISEMRVSDDGVATLFLEQPRMALVLDVDDTASELGRASQVMRVWRGHENAIASLDMTTPGQAVVQLRSSVHFPPDANVRRAALRARAEHPYVPRTSAPEETASR